MEPLAIACSSPAMRRTKLLWGTVGGAWESGTRAAEAVRPAGGWVSPSRRRSIPAIAAPEKPAKRTKGKRW